MTERHVTNSGWESRRPMASPKSIAINGDSIATAGGSGRAIHY